MPIVRIADKLVYFAHVPKCGGSAVEHYLWLRFGRLAFIDPRFYRVDAALRWSRTSPQHISADALARYFPPGFFDASFSVVRHPVDRLVSEYHHLRDAMARIPKSLGFSEWLASIPATLAADRWAHDNHLRPICDMLPSGTTWFRLEDGLQQVVRYLDTFAGNQQGPREIEPAQQRNSKIVKVVPSARDLEMIQKLYARDLETFGYTRRAPSELKAS